MLCFSEMVDRLEDILRIIDRLEDNHFNNSKGTNYNVLKAIFDKSGTIYINNVGDRLMRVIATDLKKKDNRFNNVLSAFVAIFEKVKVWCKHWLLMFRFFFPCCVF